MKCNVSIMDFVVKRQIETKEDILLSSPNLYSQVVFSQYKDVNYGVMTGQLKSCEGDYLAPEWDIQYALIVNSISPSGKYDIPINKMNIISNLTEIVFLIPHKNSIKINSASVSALADFIKKICLMVPNPISVKFVNPFLTSTYIDLMSEVINSLIEDNINLSEIVIPTAYLWKCNDFCNILTSLRVKELTLADTYVQPNIIYGLEPFYETEFGSDSDERKFNNKINQYLEEIQGLMREKTVNLYLLPPEQCIEQIMDDKSRVRMELAYCLFNKYLIENLEVKYPQQFLSHITDNNTGYFKPFDIRLSVQYLPRLIEKCPLLVKCSRGIRVYELITEVEDIEQIISTTVTNTIRTFSMMDTNSQNEYIDTYCNIILNKDILPIYLTYIHSIDLSSAQQTGKIKIFEFDNQKRLKKYTLDSTGTTILCDLGKSSHRPFDSTGIDECIIIHSPYDIC